MSSLSANSCRSSSLSLPDSSFSIPSAYEFGPRPTTGAFSQSVLLLVYAFTGFEMATIPAGEVRDPQRNLPRALLIAILVVAILYIMIQVVCVGTLPGLAQSQKPLADAGSQFLGAAGGAIISAGAIISITGNLNILLLSGSRLPFAMAEQKQLPEFIGSVHRKFFTPYVVDPDHGGVDAVFDVEELICCGADDQHDCAACHLWSDVPVVACFSCATRRAGRRSFDYRVGRCRDFFVAVDRLVIAQSYFAGSKGRGNRSRLRDW